jgi:hypothetical protein
MSRFLFNGSPDADPSLATFIRDARFDDCRDAVMIRNYFHPEYTLCGGPPARAYNTNPNLIIPLDSSLYIDLVDDTNPDYTGSNFPNLWTTQEHSSMMSPSVATTMSIHG